ncbi:SEC-C metal-binding domain-containing protein [Paenibacillus cisolokensis]|uniref:YecA family protein n=1 Tax=Paenibacillus cisolokensis TaxID=1658519 RepID=UPI003D296BFD
MSFKLSDREMEQIAQWVDDMGEDAFEAALRKGFKRWQKIEARLSFEEGLSRLTKQDIHGIARRLGLAKVSALRKEALIDAVIEHAVGQLDSFVATMDEDRFRVLESAAKNDGLLMLDQADMETAITLMDMGLVYSGKHDDIPVLVMPQELIEPVVRAAGNAALRERIRRNTEQVKLVRGMLHFYGVMELEEAVQLLLRYIGLPNEFELIEALIEASNADYFQLTGDAILADMDVEDWERLLAEHRMRQDLPFFPFDKKELIRAAAPDYIHRNTAYDNFRKQIRRIAGLNGPQAEQLADEVSIMILQGRNYNDIVIELVETLRLTRMDQMQKLAEAAMPMFNGTKQWMLKGHAPNEVRALQAVSSRQNVVDMRTRRKAGRNDPCPCGSGRKFKKCCGRS